MARLDFLSGGFGDDDAAGNLKTGLFDSAGNPIFKTRGGKYTQTDRFMPVAGVNDGYYRPFRADRSGGQALARFTTKTVFNLYTAALPPAWLAPATTMTVTYALASGAFLNAAGSVALNTNASLISMTTIRKDQKTPVQSRHRARLIRGGNNAVGEIGLITSNAPGSAVPANAIVFLYGIDGTLKPTVYSNSVVVAQGDDIIPIWPVENPFNPLQYYVWDIIFDDDRVTFVLQDPTTNAVINEQSLDIQPGDPRMGWSPFWFQYARCYVGASAGTGAATQIYVSDSWVGIIDADTYEPYADQQASFGYGSVVNPTTALAQLENYANSAAPASATLSNTAAGYGTLGGQFQFAAVAGAETDYALFGFAVPTGLDLVVRSVRIDTSNMGAAVATTPTLLQWFLGVNGTAVTLATNNFRKALGSQTLAVSTPIGGSADKAIEREFGSGLVTHSARFFHVGLKMPVGTATASQIIRGVVSIDCYFK
jgi:hypothetical protein